MWKSFYTKKDLKKQLDDNVAIDIENTFKLKKENIGVKEKLMKNIVNRFE